MKKNSEQNRRTTEIDVLVGSFVIAICVYITACLWLFLLLFRPYL